MQKGLPALEVSLVQVKAALEESFGPSEPPSMSTEYWKRHARVTQPAPGCSGVIIILIVVVPIAVACVTIPKRLWKQLRINLSDFRILEASHDTVNNKIIL